MGQMFGKKHNKKCCCTVQCCGRCLPLNCMTGEPNDCPNALPLTLSVILTATPSFGTATCFNGTGTITFKTALTGGVCCYEGRIEGDCIDCNGIPFHWTLDMSVCCDPHGWGVSGNPTAGSCGPHVVENKIPTICDPLLLDDCFNGKIVSCFTGCLDDVTSIPSPVFTVCFQIFETP